MSAESELLEDGGGERGVLAAEAEMRLDFLFPGVEIVLHLAGKNLAELGVDAADVGGQRFDGGGRKSRRMARRLIVSSLVRSRGWVGFVLSHPCCARMGHHLRRGHFSHEFG